MSLQYKRHSVSDLFVVAGLSVAPLVSRPRRAPLVIVTRTHALVALSHEIRENDQTSDA